MLAFLLDILLLSFQNLLWHLSGKSKLFYLLSITSKCTLFTYCIFDISIKNFIAIIIAVIQDNSMSYVSCSLIYATMTFLYLELMLRHLLSLARDINKVSLLYD